MNRFLAWIGVTLVIPFYIYPPYSYGLMSFWTLIVLMDWFYDGWRQYQDKNRKLTEHGWWSI